MLPLWSADPPTPPPTPNSLSLKFLLTSAQLTARPYHADPKPWVHFQNFTTNPHHTVVVAAAAAALNSPHLHLRTLVIHNWYIINSLMITYICYIHNRNFDIKMKTSPRFFLSVKNINIFFFFFFLTTFYHSYSTRQYLPLSGPRSLFNPR